MEAKSIHDLRQIASSLGVADIFEKDEAQLNQAILLQQQGQVVAPLVLPEAQPPIPTIEAPAEVVEALQPYISRGLHVRFLTDSWHMQYGKREDTGNLNIPVKDIIGCARKIMG